MASPTASPNSIFNTERTRDCRRKRKIKSSSISRDQIQHRNPSGADSDHHNQFSWKSDKTEQIYSSKLLESLKKLRLCPSSSSPSAPRRGRAVREAADRALAVAARGRTRWSRAILSNRLKLKFMKSKRPRGTALSGAGRGGRSAVTKPRSGILKLKGKNFPAVQRKVRILSRLVPGCRKEALPEILEEATDYIGALEMQIRAMTALTELLSGYSSGAGSGSSVLDHTATDHFPAN